jgi:hypothetical protein
VLSDFSWFFVLGFVYGVGCALIFCVPSVLKKSDTVNFNSDLDCGTDFSFCPSCQNYFCEKCEVCPHVCVYERKFDDVRFKERKRMDEIEKAAIDAFVLTNEISRRAAEFDVSDLEQCDMDTEYACQILTAQGFSFNINTGFWEREVNE